MRMRFALTLRGFGKGYDQRFAEEQARFRGRTAIGGRWTREANVDFSAIESEVLAARHIFFKTERDAWMTCLIFAQQAGEKWVAGKSYEADSNAACFSLGRALSSASEPCPQVSRSVTRSKKRVLD
jgi:hypothetical protein